MKDRYKVNFDNERIRIFCASISIGEGRMTLEDFKSICTRDNFYELKHSNLISVEEDIIKPTPKLRKELAERYDIHCSSSCSEEHSRLVSDSLKLVPSDVLSNFCIETAPDVERSFVRENIITGLYDENIELIRENFAITQMREHNDFHERFEALENEAQKALLSIEHQREMARFAIREEALSMERPFLYPDYQLKLSHDQLEEYVENLRLASLETEDEDRARHYQEAADKLSEKIEDVADGGSVTIAVEIVTDNYASLQIEMHNIYSEITGITQIFL